METLARSHACPPARVLPNEGIRLARETILPRLPQLDGYEEAYYLADCQSGKAERGGGRDAPQRERGSCPARR